jgi:hypothetical protein
LVDSVLTAEGCSLSRAFCSRCAELCNPQRWDMSDSSSVHGGHRWSGGIPLTAFFSGASGHSSAVLPLRTALGSHHRFTALCILAGTAVITGSGLRDFLSANSGEIFCARILILQFVRPSLGTTIRCSISYGTPSSTTDWMPESCDAWNGYYLPLVCPHHQHSFSAPVGGTCRYNTVPAPWAGSPLHLRASALGCGGLHK